MSWESTIPYYRHINETIKERLGGLHSAKVVLYSVDFHDIERLQHIGDWDAAGAMLAEASRSLEKAGSDFLVLCTNTMHKVAAEIEDAVSIPLLHIADPTAAAIKQAGYKSVGLLGTRFTMEQAFYRDRLSERHGLRVIVPNEEERWLFTRGQLRKWRLTNDAQLGGRPRSLRSLDADSHHIHSGLQRKSATKPHEACAKEEYARDNEGGQS